MADWDFSYNSLSFSAGSSGTIVRIEGLDLPDVDGTDMRYRGADGEAGGLDTYDGRNVAFQFDLAAADASAWETLLDTYRRAFQRQTADLPLVADLPGQDAKRLYCRPRRRRVPVDLSWSLYNPQSFTVQLHAADPLWYADTAATQEFDPGETFTLTNAGDESSRHWTAVISGACTNPKLELDTGDVLDFDGLTLTGGQTLTVDGRAFTAVKSTGVYVVGGPGATGEWTLTSDFFALPAGASDLNFTVDSGTPTMQFSHRSAWSSLT